MINLSEYWRKESLPDNIRGLPLGHSFILFPPVLESFMPSYTHVPICHEFASIIEMRDSVVGAVVSPNVLT